MKQKCRRIVMMVLSAFVVIAGMLFVAGCAAGGDSFDEEQSFSGIEKITIDGSFFEVDVIGRSQDSVETELSIPDRIRRRGVTVSQEKSGLNLVVTVEGRRRGSGFLQFEQPRIKVSVPTDTQVAIKTSSGSISVDGITTGEIDLKASSGKISVSDCNADLSALASSGKVVIDSCDGTKRLETSSGNILVQDSDGDIIASSSSGKHTYDGVAGSISSSSNSGRMNLSGTTGTLELQASSGNLSGTKVNLTGDSSFRTSSGSIGFDFTNDLDEFTMELQSSSGKINAGRTKASGTVMTGGGDIIVKGRSSSGRQTYK